MATFLEAEAAGDWHEIEKEFAERIEKRAGAVKSAGLGLPPARPGEKEGVYNARAARPVRDIRSGCVGGPK